MQMIRKSKELLIVATHEKKRWRKFNIWFGSMHFGMTESLIDLAGATFTNLFLIDTLHLLESMMKKIW
jgi:hypothetical protein